MKQTLIVMFLVLLGFGASAQHKSRGRAIVHPKVGMGVHTRLGHGYSSYGYGFNPLYPNRFNNSNYYNRPSKLDLQIRDIENEYRDKRTSVKLDNTLTRKERKKILKALNNEKKRVVLETRRSYY